MFDYMLFLMNHNEKKKKKDKIGETVCKKSYQMQNGILMNDKNGALNGWYRS